MDQRHRKFSFARIILFIYQSHYRHWETWIIQLFTIVTKTASRYIPITTQRRHIITTGYIPIQYVFVKRSLVARHVYTCYGRYTPTSSPIQLYTKFVFTKSQQCFFGADSWSLPRCLGRWMPTHMERNGCIVNSYESDWPDDARPVWKKIDR